MKRVVQLKAELVAFLEVEKKTGFSIYDKIWWIKVTFLFDFFDKLYSLH